VERGRQRLRRRQRRRECRPRRPQGRGTPTAEGAAAEQTRPVARRHRAFAEKAPPVGLVDRPRGVRTRQLLPASRELEPESAGAGGAAQLDHQTIAAGNQIGLDAVAVERRAGGIAVRADALCVHRQNVLGVAEDADLRLGWRGDEIELFDGVEARCLNVPEVVVAPDPGRRVAGGGAAERDRSVPELDDRETQGDDDGHCPDGPAAPEARRFPRWIPARHRARR